MDSDSNLLVSVSGRAPGRSRQEIVARLRALGDEAPLVSETAGRGVMTVRTTLVPRDVIRRLRILQSNAPGAFRFTRKWVPVDLWSAADTASLREAVTRLRDRIAPGERWRVTVERRTRGCPPAPEIIAAVADLVDRKVDLSHPDKVLLIEVFESSAALAVVSPEEVFTPALLRPSRPGPPQPAASS
jgi:tRNA(Ser,Leu) C12 N-acetylase TAN1